VKFAILLLAVVVGIVGGLTLWQFRYDVRPGGGGVAIYDRWTGRTKLCAYQQDHDTGARLPDLCISMFD